MQPWAAAELNHADLGDARLNRRLVRMIEDFAAQPSASVPQACGDWAATKAAYRFWDHPAVTPAAIRAAHTEGTRERIADAECVLVLQDTTDLDVTAHPATKGVGPLDHPALRGLKVHSALVTSREGVPLGLIHQEVWARDPEAVGQRHQRRQRGTAEKESQRWLSALAASQEALPAATPAITVADREADIYDLFAAPRRPGMELLIRATHNRRVEHETRYLWEAIRQQPATGTVTITVGRKGQEPERKAKVTLRWTSLEIHPPRHHPRRAQLAPIRLRVLLAEEEHPPRGVTPVRWLLLTTLPVETREAAEQCLYWYSLRWRIERYHYVLKSGCRVEELQLETAQRLERALATYCVVAWRLLWLLYEARAHPEQPCDTVLAPAEWQVLVAKFQRGAAAAGRPPPLGEAVRWIARLGGFLNRRSDGNPGVKTLWLGLRRLHDMAATWELVHPPVKPLSQTYG